MNRCKMTLFHIKLVTLIMLLLACNIQDDDMPVATEIEESETFAKLSYLALGDSYTIGESVSSNKSFPKQLEKKLEGNLNTTIKTKIVARTGWRTDNLLEAINTSKLDDTYDFVTLLIGVNNQFQGAMFNQYETEFTALLKLAIEFADNNPNRVVVVSIPDWSFTPFGSNRDQQKISSEIDRYNSFAKSKTQESQVRFIQITDITREGLEKPELVADDGLHPSGEAYKLFVDRIAPFITNGLKD